MQKRTITEIRQLFQSGELSEEMVQELKTDERKGVQQIIRSYEKQRLKELEMEQRFLEMTSFERRAAAKGCRYVAGVDEVGRGPLAGPVVAAAVILPFGLRLAGLRDSKQLKEEEREYFYNLIRDQAIAYGIGIVHNDVIDKINILEATKLAMEKAISELKPEPDHLLIDAMTLPSVPISQEAIIKGDDRSVSIAAASVLAKVTRDRWMKKIHKDYPQYDFVKNMGYGTKTHLEMLEQYGLTPYHRKSFAPVKERIGR